MDYSPNILKSANNDLAQNKAFPDNNKLIMLISYKERTQHFHKNMETLKDYKLREALEQEVFLEELNSCQIFWHLAQREISSDKLSANDISFDKLSANDISLSGFSASDISFGGLSLDKYSSGEASVNELHSKDQEIEVLDNGVRLSYEDGIPVPEILGILGKERSRLFGRSPEREGRALIERFSQTQEKIVRVYGLALGYHLEELLKIQTIEKLEVLEASLALIASCLWARDFETILKSGKVEIIWGNFPKDLEPRACLISPYTMRLFKGRYPDIPINGQRESKWSAKLESLANCNERGKERDNDRGNDRGNESVKDLGRGWIKESAEESVKKSVNESLEERAWLNKSVKEGVKESVRGIVKRKVKGRRILFFQSSYYLDKELRKASDSLGCLRDSWEIEDFQDKFKDREEDFRRLLTKIKDFRPDLILTVNHLGFDTDGLLSSILSRLGIPAASYFVDSPWYILKGAKLEPYNGLYAFSWDSDYLDILKDLGFKNVSYLPLATEESFFHTNSVKIKRDLSFVGDSLEAATNKYLSLSGINKTLLPLIDICARKFLENSNILPDDILKEQKDFKGLSEFQFNMLSALATWRASRLYRIDVLSSLKDVNIVGDDGWKKVFPKSTIHKPLDYYTELSGYYSGTAVNLNITSAQMKSGLNQRVFDAPASSAFLLTDKRTQLYEIFTEGKDVVTYSHPKEVPELVKYYLKNPKERERIVKNAKELINRAHLYRHRLEYILENTWGA